MSKLTIFFLIDYDLDVVSINLIAKPVLTQTFSYVIF